MKRHFAQNGCASVGARNPSGSRLTPEKTISHLNESQGNVHFSEFKEYVHANYDLVVQLEAPIRDFVTTAMQRKT
jgi:hypothetical protein